MTLNRELPPIEQAAEALNSRHRYIDMHARRQEAILAGRSLLNVEQMSAAIVEAEYGWAGRSSVRGVDPEDHPSLPRFCAAVIRAAQLGEHA